MELNAIDLISLTVPVLDLNKPQKEIRSFSTLKQVEFYPVIKSNKFLGLINSHSAKNAIESPEININDIIRSDIYIYFDTSIFDIIEYFISNKCILLPVLDENEDLLGCIDATSLLSALSNSLTYKIPGSVLTLEVAVKDYSISEISNIIESEKVAIVGLLINDGDTEDNKIEVILKLNNKNIDRVIASFERFEYTIKSFSSSESMSNDKLKDHFDALMHYLNV